MLVDFDLYDFGRNIRAIIFGSLVSSVAIVVLLSQAFGAAAIARSLVAVITLQKRVSIPVPATLDAGARGPQEHVALVEVFA